MHTYIPRYTHAYVLSYIHMYLRTYMCVCMCGFDPGFERPACLATLKSSYRTKQSVYG